MSATQTPNAPSRPVKVGKSNLVNVARSENTKLWSLRSTMWTLLALVAVTAGLSTLFSWGTSTAPDEVLKGIADPTQTIFNSILLGQLAAAVLGVLVISSEYSSGGIRTSLTAVPNAIRLIAAKIIVFATALLIAGIITAFACFFLGALFFSGTPIEVHIGDPHVLRAVFGAGLYLAASGLFGLAVGALIRKSAGAIAIAVGALVVVPIVFGSVPVDWMHSINKYLLSNPGSQILATVRADDQLSPWTGFGLFCAEILVLLIVGALVMKRRDA